MNLIRKEIDKYIGIPYWQNQWRDGVLEKEGVFGGKGTCEEILYATKCAAEKEGLSFTNLSPKELYTLRKRNHIGIDCSGLAYHLLNAYDIFKGNGGILFKIVGQKKPYGILGVRYVSASDLTSPPNSIKIDYYDDIQCGDLIRMDQGRHVIFIVEKTDSLITYVHSSDRTEIRGVHYGQIEILDPGKTLEFQKWSDTTISGENYARLFFSQKGDGIYRPSFLG